jgi:hypothetical protein
VFSEAWWVGTKEENPEERRLPLPEELAAAKAHEAFDYGYGAGAGADEGPAAPLKKRTGGGGGTQGTQGTQTQTQGDGEDASQVREGCA